jgi:hypothetical protein
MCTFVLHPAASTRFKQLGQMCLPICLVVMAVELLAKNLIVW